ncbi:hypothetical protein V7x_40180 [Crateriforma conspicua]|uniref:Uncharacterized protein n=1 Tax=Crateriforma conspicua TaxID=2527996 RepID=A0A5C6FLH7_9PLAN|nr:hypothetical protein V7x_40180 [Crateriforma conspicua]
MPMHDCQYFDFLSLDPEYDNKRKAFDRTDSSLAVLQSKLLRVAFDPIDHLLQFVNQVVPKAFNFGLIPITRFGQITFCLVDEEGKAVRPSRRSSLYTSAASVR